MGKASLFLAIVCVATVMESCLGMGYYYQPYYPSAQDLILPQYAPAAALWQPNCDKKKESMEEGSSSESSSSESSSSESSSSESKESKGSGEKEEGSSSKESKSSSEEEGSSSKEEKEEKKERLEEGEGGSGEKKEGKKKKRKESKSLFPPLASPLGAYPFPARQVMVNPAPSYAYMPYRSYVLQQPVSSYPVKANYQYVMPSTAILGGSPYVSRMIANPVTKIAYTASAISYPAVSKAYVAAPSARLYSVPTAFSYVKK